MLTIGPNLFAAERNAIRPTWKNYNLFKTKQTYSSDNGF